MYVKKRNVTKKKKHTNHTCNTCLYDEYACLKNYFFTLYKKKNVHKANIGGFYFFITIIINIKNYIIILLIQH